MPNFRAIFFQECKRFTCKKNIVILAILVLLLQYGVQKDIQDYRTLTIKSNEFQANEAVAFKNMVNYTNISSVGINILFLPAASGIFFTHPPLMTELSANINTIATLDIKNNCQGKSLFVSGSIFQICFANILLLLGSLASLFIGIDAFRDKTYLKSLCSHGHQKFIFAYVLLSRFILITASFLAIVIITLGHVFIEGLFTAAIDIPVLFAFTTIFLLNAAFFFLAGVVTGFSCSWRSKTAFLLSIWIIFVWLIPGVFQSLIINEAESITSHYKLYNEKLSVINDFEKKSIEEKGIYKKNTKEGAISVIENYWNNYFKLVEEKDEQFKEQIARVIKKHYNYFMLTPTTFYYATSDALSSRGYNNFLNFSDYVRDLRRQFLRFWIDRVYYNDPKQLVPFIKDKENLYNARPRLPENFGSGILLNLGYIMILLGISFFLFKKHLYLPENKEPIKTNNPIISIDQDLLKTLWVPKNPQGFCERIYNLLSGKFHSYNKNEPSVQLKIQDIDYTENRTKTDFFYVHHAAELPEDIKVKDFITFTLRLLKLPEPREARTEIFAAPGIETIKNKYIGKLNREERGEVLLAVLPYFKHKIYLVDTITAGMSLGFTIRLNDIMRTWTESGAAVLFLTLEREVKVESAEILNKDMNFHEQDMWSITVSRLKELGYAQK